MTHAEYLSHRRIASAGYALQDWIAHEILSSGFDAPEWMIPASQRQRIAKAHTDTSAITLDDLEEALIEMYNTPLNVVR